MKLLDRLNWSKGTAPQTVCLKSTAFKPADWSVGVLGDQAVVSSLWPLSHFMQCLIMSHVQHSHMSARPLFQLGTCAGTLLPAATKQPACFSPALWRRALKPLWCRIVAHTLHDVNIWPAPQLSLFLTNPKYWRLLLITVDTIMTLESNVICMQSWVQLIGIFIHSNTFFTVCLHVCVYMSVFVCACAWACVCACVWSLDLSTWCSSPVTTLWAIRRTVT